MRISKKILAIALSILMAVSMMPFTVFAATVEVNDVASFEAAVANASAGDTIKLTGDIDFREYPGFTRTTYDLSDKTVDLNGNTITSYNHSVVYVGDNFTIKNGNMVCEYDTAKNYKNSYAVVIYPEDGNWQTDVVNDKSENVVLENLVLTGGVNCFGADVTVKGSSTNITGNYYYALWADVKSTLTVEDGTFTSACTSTNGVIGACSDDGKEAKVDIKGGDYTVPADKNLVLLSTTPSLVDISGGTFKNADGTTYTVPTKYIAEGAVEDENGVVTQAYVAKVDGVLYADLEDAIAAARTGSAKTVTVINDVDLTSYRAMGEGGGFHYIDISGITLDLNGHEMTIGSRFSVLFTGENGKIMNGTCTGTDCAKWPEYKYGIYLWGSGSGDIRDSDGSHTSIALENLTVNYGIHVWNADVTITDCDATGSNSYYGVWADELSNVTIESGNFTSNGAAVLGCATSADGEGSIEIEDGNFTVPSGKSLVLPTSSSSKPENVKFEGGTTNVPIPEINCADGYVPVEGSTPGTYTVAVDTAVAEVNGVKYNTFEDALAAISSVTTATHSKAKDPTYQYKTYVANGTIKLLANTTSNGVIIGSGSNLTIDFNGKTLDITDKPVGSNGTETIGMQLLKDSDITFENGTLTSTADSSKKIVRLIQNYADLTLNNMTVSMKGNFYDQMTMSNCNGDVTITESTVSAPDFSWLGYTEAEAAESLGARVMSVGSFNSTAYPDVNVTITDSTINGYVNIDNSAEGATAELTLDGSDVNGNIVDKSMNGSTVTNNSSTVDGIPAGYEWNASNVLAPIEDAFNLTVEDMIHMNLYVNAAAYDADEITVTYSDPDKQNGGTKTETFAVSDLTQDAKGRYAVKILAAPAQMRDTVTVTAGSHTYTTTVAAYCEALIAQSNDANLVALAEAMLDYGKACSDEFNYNESAFASQNYYNTDDVTDALNNAAFVDTSSAHGQFTSYAYIAKSVPALRIYLNTTEAEAAALGGNALVNNEATQIMVDPNGNVCVDITGISAEDLDKEFTVEFNGGSISINALQFAKAKGGDLGRSMYNYYTAADAYFV